MNELWPNYFVGLSINNKSAINVNYLSKGATAADFSLLAILLRKELFSECRLLKFSAGCFGKWQTVKYAELYVLYWKGWQWPAKSARRYVILYNYF